MIGGTEKPTQSVPLYKPGDMGIYTGDPKGINIMRLNSFGRSTYIYPNNFITIHEIMEKPVHFKNIRSNDQNDPNDPNDPNKEAYYKILRDSTDKFYKFTVGGAWVTDSQYIPCNELDRDSKKIKELTTGKYKMFKKYDYNKCYSFFEQNDNTIPKNKPLKKNGNNYFRYCDYDESEYFEVTKLIKKYENLPSDYYSDETEYYEIKYYIKNKKQEQTTQPQSEQDTGWYEDYYREKTTKIDKKHLNYVPNATKLGNCVPCNWYIISENGNIKELQGISMTHEMMAEMKGPKIDVGESLFGNSKDNNPRSNTQQYIEVV